MRDAPVSGMSNPSWFSASKWERVKEVLHRDWDQTKHDLHVGGHELNQKIGDTVAQAGGKKEIPAIDKANPPTVIGSWEDAEIPMTYGYAARDHFGAEYPLWNDDLERKLEADWKNEAPWPTVRPLVRRGYDLRR